MPHIYLSLFCFLAASCQDAPIPPGQDTLPSPEFAIIKSLADCAPYEALLALENRYAGLYLGETHGSINTPEILECFIQAERVDKRNLVISLEMFHDNRRRLSKKSRDSGAKGVGSGTPPIFKLIEQYESATSKVQFHYHDGYYTSYPYKDETPLKQSLYTPNIEGLLKTASAKNETWIARPNARERSIGEAIAREINTSRFIVALGGNIHAARATWQEPWGEEGRAGSYLPESIATVLLQASLGGQLRFCSNRPPAEGPACDLYNIQARPGRFPKGGKLKSGAERNYDLIFDVGTWRPIDPPL